MIFRLQGDAALVDLADQTQEVIIPGYTHLQGAQPVPMAHHLLAYVEMLSRDRTLILRQEQANVCHRFRCDRHDTPIDRDFVAKELGFVDTRASTAHAKQHGCGQ